MKYYKRYNFQIRGFNVFNIFETFKNLLGNIRNDSSFKIIQYAMSLLIRYYKFYMVYFL